MPAALPHEDAGSIIPYDDPEGWRPGIRHAGKPEYVDGGILQLWDEGGFPKPLIDGKLGSFSS
jgi:hypothetical protein